MEVRLKVLTGPNAGRELAVAGPKFLIGRAEDCHLRPRSDLISRHHCALLLEEGLVAVRDFGSKNGTLVNDERVVAERELHNGDRLKIGPLEFEVAVFTTVASKKRPKVESIKEAAARTAEGAQPELDDISEWIQDEEPEQAKVETRRLHVRETDEIEVNNETQVMPPAQPAPPAEEPSKSEPPAPKLPPKTFTSTKDSGQAAHDVLSKFFKRR